MITLHFLIWIFSHKQEVIPKYIICCMQYFFSLEMILIHLNLTFEWVICFFLSHPKSLIFTNILTWFPLLFFHYWFLTLNHIISHIHHIFLITKEPSIFNSVPWYFDYLFTKPFLQAVWLSCNFSNKYEPKPNYKVLSIFILKDHNFNLVLHHIFFGFNEDNRFFHHLYILYLIF